MKWEQIDHRSWFQQITEDVYRVLIIQEYLDGDPAQNNRSFGINVMTVDVVKHAQEIEQLRIKYRGFFTGSSLEEGEFMKPNIAKLYTLDKGKSVVRVRKKDYKVLLPYIKERYGLDIQE